MPNFSQKAPVFKSGQALPANALNHIVESMKRMIVEGTGIHIQRTGDQIVIHAKGQPIPRMGGGGGGVTVHEGITIAELPNPASVPQTDFGRVIGNAGDPLGSMYIISPDRTAWICFTHFG